MIIWMFYRTDGDSGYYGIKLFRSKKKAEAYLKQNNDGYGNITEIEVTE